jgi:hypothetical protein
MLLNLFRQPRKVSRPQSHVQIESQNFKIERDDDILTEEPRQPQQPSANRPNGQPRPSNRAGKSANRQSPNRSQSRPPLPTRTVTKLCIPPNTKGQANPPVTVIRSQRSYADLEDCTPKEPPNDPPPQPPKIIYRQFGYVCEITVSLDICYIGKDCDENGRPLKKKTER